MGKNFPFQNGLGLTIKTAHNKLKQLVLILGLYSGGIIIGS